MAKNVLGSELESCSTDPMTGFFRDGCCNTGAEDLGLHTVCAEMTDENKCTEPIVFLVMHLNKTLTEQN